MATAVVSFTVSNKLRAGHGLLKVYGLATFDSGDYAAGGLDVSGLTNSLPTRRAAYKKFFYSALGYFFEWDKTNDKLIIRQQADPASTGGADAPLTELAAAALPTILAGASINFDAEYPIFGS